MTTGARKGWGLNFIQCSCLALDSGVNIQVFCNVLFLFGCHCLAFSVYQFCRLLKEECLFLFQLAVAKAMWNRTGYREEHFHLCCVKWRCNIRNIGVVYWWRGHQAECWNSAQREQARWEDKSPPVKCHIIIGESKEVTSSSSPLVPPYKEPFDNTWL